MESAKTVIRKGEMGAEISQKCHLQQAESCGQLQLTTAEPHCTGVCRQHQWPQPSLGFKWTKRVWFQSSLTGHCSDRSLCSGHCSEKSLCWPWESPKGWEQHFSFICPLTQRHFLGVSPSTHGTDDHSVAACAGWAVPLALTEFSWCALGHTQHSHRLFLVEVTPFSLDFFSLLASPSLSLSQWLMSFLCLERKLVRAQG